MKISLILAPLILAAVPALAADPVETSVKVSARRVNIRTADGEWRCTVSRGDILTAIGRHSEGDRLKVRINQKGCPGEGYIYNNFIRPYKSAGVENVDTLVEADQLALRSRPSPGARFLCGLSKDTRVSVTEEAPEGADSGSWVRVSIANPKKGCPSEGFVNGSYLKPTEEFKNLPVAQESVGDDNRNTEAGYSEPCTGDCGGDQGAAAKNIEDIGAAIPQPRAGTDAYANELRKMIKNRNHKPKGMKVSRKLVQIPLQGSRGNIGPCGSHHYTPDKPVGSDAYANPLTACVMTAALQKWKKEVCPGGGGCKIQWGDISHKSRPYFSGHKSHTDGQCMDIRPMRTGGFSDSGLNYKSGNYDRAKTTQLISMMKAMGGTKVFFNDKRTGGSYMSGHHNHVHVCFKDNEKTRATCDNLTVDPNICPELQ